MIRGEVWVDDLNIGVPGMQMFGLSTATVMVGEIKDVRTKTKRLVCVIFEYIPEFRSMPSSQWTMIAPKAQNFFANVPWCKNSVRFVFFADLESSVQIAAQAWEVSLRYTSCKGYY